MSAVALFEAKNWQSGLIDRVELLIRAQRRRRISDAKRRRLVAVAAALRLRVDRQAVWMTTIDGLASYHLGSAYDAAHLELALRRARPLATFDAALLAAMARAGVSAAALTG